MSTARKKKRGKYCMADIGIIGFGYVGQGMARFFCDHFSTIHLDPAVSNSATREEINACKLAVVCVPTPMAEDGAVDTSIVEQVMEWCQTPLILIKSTIPPGTTERLALAHNSLVAFSPEYMGEGGYYVPPGYPHPTDPKQTSFHILGGDREATEAIMPFIQRAGGPHAKYLQTDAATAELCKYMENAWIGTKVTFVNEFYDLANHFHVDFNELRELWLCDERVGRSHSMVYPDRRGFDGKCIPKDMAGIIHASKGKAQLLEAVWAVNERIRGE